MINAIVLKEKKYLQMKKTGTYILPNGPTNKPINDGIIEPIHIPTQQPKRELTNERVN